MIVACSVVSLGSYMMTNKTSLFSVILADPVAGNDIANPVVY